MSPLHGATAPACTSLHSFAPPSHYSIQTRPPKSTKTVCESSSSIPSLIAQPLRRWAMSSDMCGPALNISQPPSHARPHSSRMAQIPDSRLYILSCTALPRSLNNGASLPLSYRCTFFDTLTQQHQAPTRGKAVTSHKLLSVT